MIDHVSIGVRDVAKTKRFYDAALKPLGYHAAFVVDPDGYRIEAHCEQSAS
jgi:extradiol dioxygenase family protein